MLFQIGATIARFFRMGVLILDGLVLCHVSGLILHAVMRSILEPEILLRHDTIAVRSLFPYFSALARGIALAFMISLAIAFYIWRHPGARLAAAALLWSITFYGIGYFNPFVFQSPGVLLPGHALLSSLTAGNARTRFAESFRWTEFNRLGEGDDEKDVHDRLGPPTARLTIEGAYYRGLGADNRGELLRYSDTTLIDNPGGLLDSSYWEAVVILDSIGRVKSTRFFFRHDSTD